MIAYSNVSYSTRTYERLKKNVYFNWTGHTQKQQLKTLLFFFSSLFSSNKQRINRQTNNTQCLQSTNLFKIVYCYFIFELVLLWLLTSTSPPPPPHPTPPPPPPHTPQPPSPTPSPPDNVSALCNDLFAIFRILVFLSCRFVFIYFDYLLLCRA